MFDKMTLCLLKSVCVFFISLLLKHRATRPITMREFYVCSFERPNDAERTDEKFVDAEAATRWKTEFKAFLTLSRSLVRSLPIHQSVNGSLPMLCQ